MGLTSLAKESSVRFSVTVPVDAKSIALAREVMAMPMR